MNIQARKTFLQRFVQQVRCSSPFNVWMYTFILLGGLVLSIFSKASIHIFINQFHSPNFDVFFKYATLLGDGVSATIVVVILFFVRIRFACMAAASNILCSIIVQSLKRLVFIDSDRPYHFFNGIHQLYLVPDVDVFSFNSFPSGHSATIFTVCTVLCLMTHQRLVRLLLIIIALTTSFSRIYLSQHFFVDIYAGAIIGVIVAYATASFMNNENSIPLWLEKSILTLGEPTT